MTIAHRTAFLLAVCGSALSVGRAALPAKPAEQIVPQKIRCTSRMEALQASPELAEQMNLIVGGPALVEAQGCPFHS